MSKTELQIAQGVREAIAATLCRAYPREGCGLLLGHVLSREIVHIMEALAAPNAVVENAQQTFAIHPNDYAAAEKSARAQGLSIIGFFHSHPDSPARPSAADLEAAQGLYAFTRTAYIYAIQRIVDGTPAVLSPAAKELSFWQLTSDQSCFEEVLEHVPVKCGKV